VFQPKIFNQNFFFLFFLMVKVFDISRCCGTLREECDDSLVLQEALQGRSPTPSDVASLPICEAVILETLRLHPPAYMIGRCTAEATTLTDEYGKAFTIPKGTTALVSPYLLHRDGRRWTEPTKFSPARWLKPRYSENYGPNWRTALAELGANGTCCYIPFGGGPRNCIGTGFAMMEGFLILAMILQRWRLAPGKRSSGQKALEFPEAVPLITMQPQAVHLRLLTRVSKPLRMDCEVVRL
jgi:cytochrome P450